MELKTFKHLTMQIIYHKKNQNATDFTKIERENTTHTLYSFMNENYIDIPINRLYNKLRNTQLRYSLRNYNKKGRKKWKTYVT